MINISKQSDYAVQFMLALSELSAKELLSIGKFSNESNISFLFLQRIASSLKKAELLKSVRGVNGGYYLPEEIKQINLKQIVEAVDGKFGVASCLRGDNCPKKVHCSSHPIFNNVNKQIIDILEETIVIKR